MTTLQLLHNYFAATQSSILFACTILFSQMWSFTSLFHLKVTSVSCLLMSWTRPLWGCVTLHWQQHANSWSVNIEVFRDAGKVFAQPFVKLTCICLRIKGHQLHAVLARLIQFLTTVYEMERSSTHRYPQELATLHWIQNGGAHGDRPTIRREDFQGKYLSKYTLIVSREWSLCRYNLRELGKFLRTQIIWLYVRYSWPSLFWAIISALCDWQLT